MSDDSSSWRESRLVYVLVALLVISPAVVYALTYDVTVQSGSRFKGTPTGPTIYFDEDRTIPSGNPFPADNSVHIQTSSGSAYYNSTADTTARVDTINGTWSNVSALDVTAGNLTINPDNMAEASIAGDASVFKFKGEAQVNDGDIDAYVSGIGGSATITLETNGSQGTMYGLVDVDSKKALAADVAGSNGQVVFSDVKLSDHFVRVQELGDLTIREETEPHQLITGSDVEVRFFEDGTDGTVVVNRTDGDGDGTIDLTGLPVDEQFVAKIRAENHSQRTVIIEDLAQQETAFLLNDSASPQPLEKEFVISDQTGRFDAESTEIIIERAINTSLYESGGFEYLNIAGDDIGADRAYITTLQEDARYRIRVRNSQGDVRQLGAFTPKVAGTTELQIGTITAKQRNETDIAWSANITDTSSGGEEVIVQYNDSRELTDTLYIEVHERGNRSNTLIPNTTFTGPLGTVATSEPIPDGENDTEWVVRITAERTNANDFAAVEPLSPRKNLLSGLPAWLTSIMSLGIIWVTAGLFSQLNGDIGALVVAGEGAMFWFVGFAPGALGAGVVVLSLVTAALIFINERGDGGL